MAADLTLTDAELHLVQDPELFYAKQRIVQKVYGLFGALSDRYSRLDVGLPSEVRAVSPKIYRGENYLSLPYVMLDQPRSFQQDHVFAVRSLFWWGQHFSLHLVLGGRWLERYANAIFHQLSGTRWNNWYIALTDDPWHHHFDPSNYTPLTTFAGGTNAGKYLKLGALLPLHRWTESEQFFTDAYANLMSLFDEQAQQ